MSQSNEQSDHEIAESFKMVLASNDQSAIYQRRCAISVIARNLVFFRSALPKTYDVAHHDMRGLADRISDSSDTNAITFIEQNGYSAALAYDIATTELQQVIAA